MDDGFMRTIIFKFLLLPFPFPRPKFYIYTDFLDFPKVAIKNIPRIAGKNRAE